MHRASVKAAPYSPVVAAIANESPTAIPSGMLCNVTASISREFRFLIDSFSPLNLYLQSKASAPAIVAAPPAMPKDIIATPFIPPTISSAGIIMLHTEAAIITPPENPDMNLCAESFVSLPNINTVNAPRQVISSIKPAPAHVISKASFIYIHLSFYYLGQIFPPSYNIFRIAFRRQ